MLRINSCNTNITRNTSKNVSHQNFTAQNPAETSEIPVVNADYAVKTPMPYQKTGEMNLPYDTKAEIYKLANGQKIIIVPKEGSTVVQTYVNTGSMNEPDHLRGISHYIEHNLFNGSQGLEEGQFFKEVDKMGGDTNASTGFAETNYFIKSHLLNKDDLEKKIKIHASMIETPLFALEKLQKEKGIVNSEINMITSDPENIGMNKTVKNLFGIKSTSTDLIGGNTDNINNLTREDVVNYFNQNYYPANMVTVITGEVEPEETMKLVSKYFTSKKQPVSPRHYEELKPLQKTKREDIISDKATATSIIMGFAGPSYNSVEEGIYCRALDELLTSSSVSRVNNALKPLNTSAFYSAEKVSTKFSDPMAIFISAVTTENNNEKALKALYYEISALKSNPPTDEEMQIIKKKMIKDFSDIFEMSHPTNRILGDNFLCNTAESLNNYEKIVNAMTPADLVRTAEKYFDLNKAAVTVVHPALADEKSIKNNYSKANNISFTGNTQKKTVINTSRITQYNTANNFRVVTNDINSDNVHVTASLIIDKTPQAKPGITAILSRILSEGSIFRDEKSFKTDLYKSGIEFSASSGADFISAEINLNSSDLSKGLKCAKEVIFHPRFTEETLMQVKNDLKEHLKTVPKSAIENLDAEIYKGLPQNYTNKEILDNVDNITLEDVKSYYENLTNNAKGRVVISAPFSKKPVLKDILFGEIAQMMPVKEFSRKEHENTYFPIEKTKVITDTNNKNQTEIIEAFKYKKSDNIKDEAAISLLNCILGGGPSSRLFSDLRENQKLAYHVRSRISEHDDSGCLTLRIKTTTENSETGEKSYDNVQKSIEGFNKHIANLLNENVSENELNNAKLSLKNDVLSGNESNFGKHLSVNLNLDNPYGMDKENIYFETIDKITPEDIRNAAKYIFSQNPTYSLLGTENTITANEKYLKTLEE